jgi:microcystin-dependent protein
MDDHYLGEIRMFAGSRAPRGWALCDGQLLQISGNDALYTLLGTTYGGDGISNFGLPDLRGRAPVHQSSSFAVGQSAGVEQVVLTTSELPAHTHYAHVQPAKGETGNPENQYWAQSTTTTYTSTTTPHSPMNESAVSGIGGNRPHNNMMPFTTISFMISTWGIFPAES